MSRAVSPSTELIYGLARVLRAWEINRSTFYYRRGRTGPSQPGEVCGKRGPEGPCPDQVLLGHIRRDLKESPWHGEGHRKVWARLRFKGIRTSRARVLRLMRENGLLAPMRAGNAHGPKAHDGTIRTEKPDEMWGTDMTSTVTLTEGSAAVFVAVDHATMECIGIHTAKSGNRFEALEPIRQGVRERFGSYTGKSAAGLAVRHDHGSAYVSDVFQSELRFLGIKGSPAFVREPEGNGCAERFIRILKENLLWVKSFETIEEMRQALLEFKDLYNRSWLLQRHGYLTPAQARERLLAKNSAA